MGEPWFSPTSNALPIFVFELADGNIRRVAAGERAGTIIATEPVS